MEIHRLEIRATIPPEKPASLEPHLTDTQWNSLREGMQDAVRRHYVQSVSLSLLLLTVGAATFILTYRAAPLIISCCCMNILSNGSKGNCEDRLRKLFWEMQANEVPRLHFGHVREKYSMGQLSISLRNHHGSQNIRDPATGGFLPIYSVPLPLSFFATGGPLGQPIVIPPEEQSRRMLTEEQVDRLAASSSNEVNVEEAIATDNQETAEEEDESARLCAICLDDCDEEKANLMSLPCRHRFHKECIVEWLTTQRANCPLCNDDLWTRIIESSAATRGSSILTGVVDGGDVEEGGASHSTGNEAVQQQQDGTQADSTTTDNEPPRGADPPSDR